MLPLVMTPAAGERVLRFVGDRLRFSLGTTDGRPLPSGWRALLRTNLGRARALRREIICSYPARPPLAGAPWHDLALFPQGREWGRELSLAEAGFFRAKAYAVDPQGRQYWPGGPDLGLAVHPDSGRVGHTIYCAFVRLFGPAKGRETTAHPELDEQLDRLDQQQFTVIPPSGTLRDLIRELPHIFGRLGCRILHLLPVTPTPTTQARFGRFGSPYAVQDLTAIDPALVEFDKRTTGLDQFRELTYASHQRGGRVFLDIPINHTGWGATLQENHPEWYLRNERGEFVSPGAWGVTWEDLVELDHHHPELWRNLAEVFLTWCRRGVDGFRCDAGYKVPVEVWRYITARVHEEFPETVFLLEGLGGSWEATEALLTDGGMQWAYSELFQNYSGQQVAGYLDYSLRQSQRTGLYVHYSETHDNNRLAAKGRPWALLRNRLCALASPNGGYGFTCGVEWLAPEKIDVHLARGLRWGSPDNIVEELARLNRLLAGHPCFFDGAKLTRLSSPQSPVLALRRDAAETGESVLVLANTDAEHKQKLSFDLAAMKSTVSQASGEDLLGQSRPDWRLLPDGKVEFSLAPAAVFCLEMANPAAARPRSHPQPTHAPGAPESGRVPVSPYSQARARAAWAVQALAEILPPEEIGPYEWRKLSDLVDRGPDRFLAALPALDRVLTANDLLGALEKAAASGPFPAVVTWRPPDHARVTLVPWNHWVLVHDDSPFRATLVLSDASVRHTQSFAAAGAHFASFPPAPCAGTATLQLERYDSAPARLEAILHYLECGPPPGVESADPAVSGEGPHAVRAGSGGRPVNAPPPDSLVLLANGRGGMARLCVDLGRVTSKYDCLLGANLHPTLPVDRHVLAKRARVWVVADGFITALNRDNLVEFVPGPPALWRFVANAGDGRAVEIQLGADMPEGRNTTVLQFHRPDTAPPLGRSLPRECAVNLTVRVDIEDRNFHSETHRNGGAEHHFSSHCHPEGIGFAFTPAADRQLRVVCDRGTYHHEAEWCEHIPHPVEATRGLVAEGDAYSPGWFDIPLGWGDRATLVVTAEPRVETPAAGGSRQPNLKAAAPEVAESLEQRLVRAARAFVVRRGPGRTVIAGYPWFLDWGRDTLIAARGLLAAGWREEVREILQTFGRFEENGTLPNAVYGDNASNRDTCDAPLWFGLACEELAALESGSAPAKAGLYSTATAPGGRTLAEILGSIALNYMRGTPNGVRMDAASGLIWSPSHFTWMDTNYPAATPREGYPVEIQALWVRLLRQLDALGWPAPREPWAELAARAEASLLDRFWLEERGWLADVLLAQAGQAAGQATPQDALRSNCLLAITCGPLAGERARRCVEAVRRHLLVPGGLRSLAPLPVMPPLPAHAADGRPLHDPHRPYWGSYEGDEDTRRKPAYHNGTAWVWTLPVYCEALASAWDFQPQAVAAARAYLDSLESLLDCGCLGQLPEILDGDAPHTPRGCDAQAWSVTEALRVCKLLTRAPAPSAPPR